MRLPWGVVFHPTEVELAAYLRSRVVAGSPLPAGVPIGSRDLYAPDADPWVVQRELASPHVRGSTFYCFTARTRRRGSGGVLRNAGSGAWVAKGKDVVVRDPLTGQAVGRRLMLNFVPKNHVHGGRPENGNWIMHEFRLPDDNGAKRKDHQVQDVVICKVYRKRKTGQEEEDDEADDDDDGVDFPEQLIPASASFPF